MYPKVVDICPNIILIVIFIMFTFLHGVWKALHHVVTGAMNQLIKRI